MAASGDSNVRKLALWPRFLAALSSHYYSSSPLQCGELLSLGCTGFGAWVMAFEFSSAFRTPDTSLCRYYCNAQFVCELECNLIN